MKPLWSRLFADEARLVVVSVLVVLLAVDIGVWVAWRVQSPPPYVRCLESPDTEQPCLGEELVFPLQFVQAIHGPDRFRIGRMDGSIAVLGDSTELRVGQEVTVGGVRTAEGVEASFVQTHPGRPWKRRLGLVGVVVLAFLLPVAFTVRRTEAGWRVIARGRAGTGDGHG